MDLIQYKERFTFATERIREIAGETEDESKVRVHGADFFLYIQKTALFLIELENLYHQIEDKSYYTLNLAEMQKINQKIYQDVTGEHYEKSYANPSYAVKTLGTDFGPLLCALYTELRGNIVHVFEQDYFYLATTYELFIQIYNILEEKDAMPKEIRECLYYYFFDYADITVKDNLRKSFDPSYRFATDIIMQSDLNDLRYLYHYGEYISENELAVANYLNSLSEQQIKDMAFTFTDGYRRGFDLYRIDLSKKHSVNIRYRLGFERMIKEVICQFEELGLKPCIYRAAVSMSNRNLRGKVGYFGASPNRQYDYDHRMDDSIFFDKAYSERKLQEQKIALEELKDFCNDFAGPAVMETFGEAPFNPVDKKEALHYSEKQQKQKLSHQAQASTLSNRYIPGDQISFSIIAYPLPEIGTNFEEIFADTIRVNTLDQEKYLKIQQCIIDALDQGEFVTITGRGANRTDLKVALAPLNNPAKETKFENCLADVNIPLGEVFTSPKLEGTNGILHVTRVFLNDLEYHDFSLTFTDGIVTDYDCKNFERKEDNQKYIAENVLFHHKTLPMGEFAIGTNTTAYAMGRKHRISDLLPILIAEKTGPHFAVGDTCFSHEEDLVTYNPDGKQMIAKENDYSLLRHETPEKAYFSCHTDVTIPYDELGDIIVHKKDGSTIALIKQGRFVLPGTEVLNEALDMIE